MHPLMISSPAFCVSWNTLAGKRAGIQRGGTFHDHSVNGHFLPGLNGDHRFPISTSSGSVCSRVPFNFHIGVIRADIHQFTDIAAAFANRITLE